MKELIKKLPQELQDVVETASSLAHTKGIRAYLVGGCVRDMILGARNLDLDIVVEGNGLEFGVNLGEKLKAKVVTHKRFKTSTVFAEDAIKIDITTSRQEHYPHPGSLPVVRDGLIDKDLFRRDFTINSLAVSINQDDFGKLLDVTSGKADLAKGCVRVLHDLSFVDDPTRILRAVRFEQRYGFKIEPKTLALLKQAVKKNMLINTEPQRIRDELILMLKEKNAQKMLKRLAALTKLSFLHLELKISNHTWKLMHDTSAFVRWFESNYPGRRRLDHWLIYLMVLFKPLSMNCVYAFCRRFVLTKNEEKRLIASKAVNPDLIRKINRKNLPPALIYSLLEPLSYEVIILLKAITKNKNAQKHISDYFEIYNDIRISVGGEDLRSLGLAPGPRYQDIFSKVLGAKLDGLVKTREEELELIKKLMT